MKCQHHVDYSAVEECLPAPDCGDCPGGTGQRSTAPVVIAQAGEGLLAMGLACLALGIGQFFFPIIGLLGLLFFGASLALLITAGVLSCDGTRAFVHTASVLVAFLVGLALLCHATAEIIAGIQERALHAEVKQQPELGPVPLPPAPSWAALAAVAGSAAMAVGLRLRAGWSAVRTVAWGLAVSVVVPATVARFLQLATFLPLGA